MGYFMSQPLTQEQARLASEDYLWNSKVPMRHSMFMIQEYIQNEDLGLTSSKNTTIVLSKGGDNFFKAHIEDNERY